MTKWVLLPLCLWAGACGDDDSNGRLPDAPTSIEASVDPMPVTVTVTFGGKPSANQTVYFQSKDSVTTETRQTDASGNASAVVEAGGFVTVIEPARPPSGLDAFTNLSSFAAVQPGDHLYVDVPGSSGEDQTFTVNVSVPNEEVGNDYWLYTTCGSGEIGRGNGQVRAPSSPKARARKGAQVLAAVTNTITLFEPCGGTADVLALAFDPENFLVKWAYKPNVAVASNTNITFDAWTDSAEMTFDYTFVSGSHANFQRRLYTARGPLYTIFDDVFGEGTQGAKSIQLPNPDGVSALTISNDNPNEGSGQNYVVEWGANTSYALDFNTTALHNFQSSADVDAAGHKVTWDEATDGKTPDFALATFSASRGGEGDVRTWSWRIMAPYTAGAVTYPVLPTTLYDFNPKASDSFESVRNLTVHNPGGYNAARNSHLFRGEDNFYDLETGVAGASGQIVYEQFYFAGELTGGTVKAPDAPRAAAKAAAKAKVRRAPSRAAR